MSRLGQRFDAGESFLAELGCALAMIAFVGTIAFLALVLPGCGEPFTTDLFGDSSAQGGAGGEGDGSAASDGGAGASDASTASGQGATAGASGVVGGAGDGGRGGGEAMAGGAGSVASGGGGGGGSEESCGPSTCAGCCDADGACQLGSVDAACGFGGEACAACVDTCGYDASFDQPNAQCGYPGVGVQHWECVAFACAKKQDGTGYTGSCCFSPTCANGACQ